jgi:uncharacterized protein DUF4124
MKRLTLLLVSLSAASMAWATTYVRVEKDGSKTYSDRPLPGGQPVELQAPQTYSAPQNSAPAPVATPEQRALQGIDDFTYTSCSLSPVNDETFENPESVTVSVTTSPALRAGDTVNLVVDGKALEPYDTSVVLTPVDRGQHTASVTLRDTHGRTLCSASVTFNVLRPSLNSPRRR